MNSQDIGGFIFSDKFLQISFLLPSDNIYGLGEHQGSFLLKSDWQRYTLFNHDTAPGENVYIFHFKHFQIEIVFKTLFFYRKICMDLIHFTWLLRKLGKVMEYCY